MLEFLWLGPIEDAGKRPASDRKRRRLREQGDVVTTPLAAQAARLSLLTFALFVWMDVVVQRLAGMFRILLDFGDVTLDPAVALDTCLRAGGPLVAATALFPLVAFLSRVGQVGLAWSPKAFRPAWASRNPASVFTSGFRPADSLLCLAAGLLILVALIFFGGLDNVDSMLSLDTDAFVRRALSLSAVLSLILALCAVFDYVLRRRHFELSIAMTPDELRRESWEDEGRPEVRRERMERASEMLSGRKVDVAVLSASGDLTVLAREGGTGTPVVTMRVRGAESIDLLRILRERGVTIVHNAVIGGRLALLPLGSTIPEVLENDVIRLYRQGGVV